GVGVAAGALLAGGGACENAGPWGGARPAAKNHSLGRNSGPRFGPRDEGGGRAHQRNTAGWVIGTVRPGGLCCPGSPIAASPRKGSPGGSMNFNRAHCAAARLWCQEKTLQDMGVWLRARFARRKMADDERSNAKLSG